MACRWKLYLLNLYFYGCFLALSATVIPLLTLSVAALRILGSHRSAMRRFRRAITWYGRLVIFLAFPFVSVRYERRQPEGEGANIFVCNHRSASDAFLMAVLPHEVVQVVNTWPFRIPVLGIYAKLSGYLNIRAMSHEAFMEQGMTLLREGVSLVFFPEGTRSATGKLGSFHSAAFRLALASGVPLVPLCISGNHDIPPKGSLLLHPGKIVLRRLPPIGVEQYQGLSPFALKNLVWKAIDCELAAMEGGA